MTDDAIAIEQLFDRSALSPDPVFGAYHRDRAVLEVPETGVEITASNIQFAFFEPGELGILTAESAREGDMSTLVDHACRHFGVTHVLFINVLSDELAAKLRGFEPVRRSIGGEEMDCLAGEWQVAVRGGVPP